MAWCLPQLGWTRATVAHYILQGTLQPPTHHDSLSLELFMPLFRSGNKAMARTPAPLAHHITHTLTHSRSHSHSPANSQQPAANSQQSDVVDLDQQTQHEPHGFCLQLT